MRNRQSALYRVIVRSLPIVFVVGAIISAIGAYRKNLGTINIGVGIFLAAIAAWGFLNGGFLLWLFFKAGRKLGLRNLVADSAAHPFKTVIFCIFTVLLVAIGIAISWLIWGLLTK